MIHLAIARPVPATPILPIATTLPTAPTLPVSKRTLRHLIGFMPRLSLLDRYLLGSTLRAYFAFVLIVVLLLSLESLPGLLPLISKIGRGGSLLFRLLASLAPEYVGIGLPVGLFVASAVTLRRLGIDSERDAMAAAGISDLRMAAPLIVLAMAACALQFAVRSYAQPWGERTFDQLIRAAAIGDFGLDLAPAAFNRPNARTVIYFDRIAENGSGFEGVLVQTPAATIVAASGSAVLDVDMQLQLSLHHGTLLPAGHPSGSGIGTFRQIALTLPFDLPSPRGRSTRDRLDRLSLSDLLALAEAGDKLATPANAAAAARVSSALLCLLMPILALGIAIPPKKSTSSFGAVLGIILLTGYFRLSGMIEDSFASRAILSHAMLLTGLAALCGTFVRMRAQLGDGSPGSRWLALISAANSNRLRTD